VYVVDTPPPLPVATPDPVASSALDAAWQTYTVSRNAFIAALVAIIVAFAALWVAILDARNNSQQLGILLDERSRKPELSVVFDNDETSNQGLENLGGIEYEKAKVGLYVLNGRDAGKSASALFVEVYFPEEVITSREFEKRLRALEPPAGGTIGLMMEATRTFRVQSVMGRSSSIMPNPLISESKIERALEVDGYRVVRYSTKLDDVLLAGLGRPISDDLILYYPLDAGPIKWSARCHELNDGEQSGELSFVEIVRVGENEAD
jgi:hypothetical protein